MTCIAGVVDKVTGEVVIGGDSAAIADYDMLTMSTPKVFKTGEYVFGFAGNIRFAQIVQHVFTPPKVRGKDIPAFMALDFAENLRHVMKATGFGKNKDGRDEGGLALVGCRGHLFMLQHEFDVIETYDGMHAIGIGSAYALAAMKALRDQPGMDTAAIVQRSLEISEWFSGGVRGPFTVITLEGRSDAKGNGRNPSGHRRAKGQAARPRGKRPRASRTRD